MGYGLQRGEIYLSDPAGYFQRSLPRGCVRIETLTKWLESLCKQSYIDYKLRMANPNPLPIANRGANAGKVSTGFQDPGPRGRYLVEKYGMAEIMKFYKLMQQEDGALAVPLSTQDCLLVGRIARAQKDDNALDKLYDRTFGKVPDRSINLNINADVDPEKLSEQAAEMLARLAD